MASFIIAHPARAWVCARESHTGDDLAGPWQPPFSGVRS